LKGQHIKERAPKNRPAKILKRDLEDLPAETVVKRGINQPVFTFVLHLNLSDSYYFDIDDEDLDDDDDNHHAAWQRKATEDLESANLGGGGATGGSSSGRIPGCPYCGKELRNMTRHIEDVHCPVEIACPLCGKICTSRNKLRTHQAQVCFKRFMAAPSS
jgi:hypothetical protein